jgi:hypothetical protein
VNYRRPRQILLNREYYYEYDDQGTLLSELDPGQPNTALKMAIFRLSDCMLQDSDRGTLVEIARHLVCAGAELQEAVGFFESRYGCPDAEANPSEPFAAMHALLQAP